LLDDSPDGQRARAAWGDRILARETRTYVTDGIALGYSYDNSPIIIDDGTPASPASISTYSPTTRPGARAPHAWLSDGRSILDLFGSEFVLVHNARAGLDAQPIRAAFADRGVPLTVTAVDGPETAALYDVSFILVRPDGHVAWRSSYLPDDPSSLVARVTGVSLQAV
jgi:hypothetical protein